MFIKIELLDKTQIMRYRHDMDFYRSRFTFWQIFLVMIILVQAFLTSGCNGTRFVFSSDKGVILTPAEVGLNYDEVWFDTKDEVPIHGWSIPGQTDMPLIIFFHGNAANISHYVDILRYFNEMGFSTFIFDYRGFGIEIYFVVTFGLEKVMDRRYMKKISTLTAEVPSTI